MSFCLCQQQTGHMQVPMEKIFNKSLLSKFHWAMEVEPDFRF